MYNLKIALDYDETFTAAPDLFTSFVSGALASGHEVKFVTARSKDWDNGDISYHAGRLGIGIIYCSLEPKRFHYDADIWIDDTPEAIVSGGYVQDKVSQSQT